MGGLSTNPEPRSRVRSPAGHSDFLGTPLTRFPVSAAISLPTALYCSTVTVACMLG